ncbi:syntaxin-1A [Halyomorpha halys]|uniref:syntaxin-1A n=1 Tax=Halyomorpha halys TaxID=286706 RepID=UPI0006D51AC1|nr:syntaxin-1A-like [Halyomorpha halys]
MTKDRLDQLINAGKTNSKKVSKPAPQQTEEGEEAEENEMTALTGQTKVEPVIVKTKNKESKNLDKVYKQVNNINALISQINEDIVQLKRYHVRMQQSTRTETRDREQIDSLNENIKITAIKIKTELEELEKEKKGNEEMVIYRVVKTQHSLITKRFRETMEDYENSLTAHKKICEDIIKRQLKIVIERLLLRKVTCVPADREVTDEQLCTILDAEDTAVFVDNYTKETLEARQSLEDARDRHKDILQIEKTIATIREMFFDIAMQVTQQGELIERIEYHIGDGYVLTQKGHKKLNKAEILMRKARKKKCWLIICLLIVITIIVLYILVEIFLIPN